MQAMPVMPTDTKAPPAPTDQAAAIGRDGAKFRSHLAAATGRQARQQGADRDGGTPSSATAAASGPDPDNHHQVEDRLPGRKEKPVQPETVAEQATAPGAGTQEVSPAAILALAALTGTKVGSEAPPLQPAQGGGRNPSVPAQAAVSPQSANSRTTPSGTDGRLPVFPLESLRLQTDLPATKQTVLPATEQTDLPATTTARTGSMKHGPAAAGGEVVVERWAATFSTRTTQAGPEINTAAGSATAADNDSTIGQTLVSVQRIPDNEEMLSSAPPAGARASRMDTGGQRQDINSSYIHANLPNQATRGDTGPGNGQQSGDQGQDAPDLRSGGDQVRQQQAPPAPGDQPLVFSLDQAGGVGATTGQQSVSQATTLHQTSGLPVSDAHVMDQVIQHFHANRQLESGTVVLRLHPQELGELRMEIKVEQDNIKAHVTTNNPQVQDILDRHLPRLREALEQQGMTLEQMQVTVATGDNSNTQLFQEHRGRQQTRRPVRPIGSRQQVFTLADEEPDPGPQTDDKKLSILA